MADNPDGQFTLLAVDDNSNALEIIKRTLSTAGYDVLTCDNVVAGVELLVNHSIDLVITDLKMPKHSGLDLIRHVNENYPEIGVIMITGYPSIDAAVEAVKQGAEEFLAKPFTDEELLSAVQGALKKLSIRRESKHTVSPEKSYGIVGDSAPMQKVFNLIAKATTMSANVLISGESGTGKELVARAIHYGSARSVAPFVPVNCTAIPESLLESELFGHVKGAFTGANVSRIGFFQMADGGTVFLDEIGDASQSLQAKLLRVIQNKEITMVGSSRAIKVNTRIVAATHQDLEVLIGKNQFREDLFYRLSVLDIHIPSLREHKEDIPLLIGHFAANFCREMNREPIDFSDRAIEAMTNYAWPGNVRELENLIQKLIVIAERDTVDVADLPASMRFHINPEKGLNKSLAQVESEHINRVLDSVGGNKSKAAQILRINRKTLREKLKKIQQNQ
ncbi:MAG: sigma-54 dependent transcriptional regulator [Desulfobacterales bacterium]